MVSLADALRTTRDFDVWANHRVLAAAEQLSQPAFIADRGGGYGSIRDTLVHLLAGQQWLLTVASGKEFGPYPNNADFPDAASVQTAWTALDVATAAYFATLDDAMLAETAGNPVATDEHGGQKPGYRVDPANPVLADQRWRYPRWQILFHLSAHAMQHRSEVALALTQLGHSPGWIDWIAFLWEQREMGVTEPQR